MNPHQFLKAFRIMADSISHGAVLFSCAAGKDRTGIIAAMTLLLCGVSQVDMVADYMVIEVLLEPCAPLASGADAMAQPHVFRSEPDTQREFLNHLEGRHGDPGRIC